MELVNLLILLFCLATRVKAEKDNQLYVDNKEHPELKPKETEQNGTSARWVMIPDLEEKVMRLVDLDAHMKNLSQNELNRRFNAENDIDYKLYTRNHRMIGENLNFNADHIRSKTSFNPNNPTRVIIHGWINHYGSPINRRITEAFLDRGDFNIIVVGWGQIAINPDYIQVTTQLADVGAAIGKFIDFMVSNNFIDLRNLSIIGHSLGAHVAGLAGRSVKTGKVQTIIGLDPAGPMFTLKHKSKRLADTDAVYVEVIHTNAGLLGFTEPIGQADFYPNGGASQKGCVMDVIGICAHNRVIDLFVESLNQHNSLLAIKCPSYTSAMKNDCKAKGVIQAFMGGEPPNRGLSGTYRLSTHPRAPFGMN